MPKQYLDMLIPRTGPCALEAIMTDRVYIQHLLAISMYLFASVITGYASTTIPKLTLDDNYCKTSYENSLTNRQWVINQ